MNDQTPQNEPTASSEMPPTAPVEMIRKVYVKDLKPGQRVHSVFRVEKSALQTGRSGKPFVTLSLMDKTGELDARIFERAEERSKSFSQGDYLLVEGQVGTFQKKLQLVIDSLDRLDPEPIDASEFTFKGGTRGPSQSPASGSWRELVERITEPKIRSILAAVLEDGAGDALASAKVARQAPPGSLLERTSSLTRLCVKLADHYGGVDRSLLLAGALLRPIGQALVQKENGEEGRSAVPYGVRAAQALAVQAAKLDGIPPSLLARLTSLAVVEPLGEGEGRARSIEAHLLSCALALEAGAPHGGGGHGAPREKRRGRGGGSDAHTERPRKETEPEAFPRLPPLASFGDSGKGSEQGS